MSDKPTRKRSLRPAKPAPAPPPPPPAAEAPERPSKKEQILSLFHNDITEVKDIAVITNSRPSYVASVLTAASLPVDYHDLYTSTSHPMNVYSKFFAGQLGFRDEAAARASVALLDRYYRQFALAEDRAGQHHTLLMALTMFDRARWTNKPAEAEIFRRWLTDRLNEPTPQPAPRRAR
ncbi:MAG TPA: hypothetical protein VFW33_01685 [Gemmataceae bacterium]|nr:hypothetical protein [Gemmataceae bacterium]